MKSIVFGIVFSGLASLGFSQENMENVQTVELEAITISANASYLTIVNDLNTPDVVRELNLKAASFDPNSAKDYDPKSEKPYVTVFKATNGSLIAAYGPGGQINSSHARFSNVSLPLAIREEVFEGHEGWKMTSNQFLSTYVDNRQTKKKYKIHMQNGERSKRLIVDLR